MNDTPNGGPREWLILDPNGRSYWRLGGRGYDDVLGAGLFGLDFAESIERLGRGDRKVHISDKYVQAAIEHARVGLAYFDAEQRARDAAKETR